MTAIITVSGGCVVDVKGCTDYIVIDLDESEELPELPEGFVYGDDGEVIETEPTP